MPSLFPSSAPSQLGLSAVLVLEPNGRTGLALLLAGVSLSKFFRENAYVWLGVGGLPLGLGSILLGWVRFLARRRQLAVADSTRLQP